MGQSVTGWKAIVTSGYVSAKDHIGKVSGLQGIYLPSGTRVVDNEGQLWNKDHENGDGSDLSSGKGSSPVADESRKGVHQKSLPSPFSTLPAGDP